MFVKRVFQIWLLALVQADADIAGDGGGWAEFAPPRCGELGAIDITHKVRFIFFSSLEWQ